MMQPFIRCEAVAAPMAAPDIDTDQIIPARFLRKSRRDGLAAYLFRDLRFDASGGERQDFVLNQAPYRNAAIIVANRNFGCGSSREYAVYALWDYGVRVVIAPSFGDIFFNNCFKNGLLPVTLPQPAVDELRAALEAAPGARIGVDLEKQRVVGPAAKPYAFDIDPFRKQCLLAGVDELGFTLQYRDAIDAFEEERAKAMPWLAR